MLYCIAAASTHVHPVMKCCFEIPRRFRYYFHVTYVFISITFHSNSEAHFSQSGAQHRYGYPRKKKKKKMLSYLADDKLRLNGFNTQVVLVMKSVTLGHEIKFVIWKNVKMQIFVFFLGAKKLQNTHVTHCSAYNLFPVFCWTL
uniref:Uncharacterized protein n=1 Tax=Lygus hesperus TaxID=30085 RepID=A0A0A9Y047_LYGHE